MAALPETWGSVLRSVDYSYSQTGNKIKQERMLTTFEERLRKLAINNKHTAGHRDRRKVGQQQSRSGGSESDRLPLVDALLTVHPNMKGTWKCAMGEGQKEKKNWFLYFHRS